MGTQQIVKESKAIMIVTLSIGIVLLVVGIVLSLLDVSLISNNKAIIGISFIPLSVALAYYIKLSRIKNSPQAMRNIIINESDERLISLRNEADAKAFKIFQGILFLTYMGYTLIVPEDIFESVGWWILMSLLFISFVLQGIMTKNIMDRDSSRNDEE